MKKIILVLILVIVALTGCQVTETPKSLSELQITACNTANEAGTCDTRLAELGIVLTEECCQLLGKCC